MEEKKGWNPVQNTKKIQDYYMRYTVISKEPATTV